MEEVKTHSLNKMIKNILSIMLPTSLGFIAEVGLTFLNLSFIGHLNNEAMTAAIGMGNVIFNVIGIGLAIGFNGAVETMVSQSYGNGNLHRCGDILNKARVMSTINWGIQLLILLNIRPFLDLLKIDEEVAGYMETYLTYMAFNIYFYSLFDANRRLLNCLGFPSMAMIIQGVSTLFHCLGCYLFIHILELEMTGVGIQSILTQVVNILGITIYSHLNPAIKESWFLPSAETFQNFKAFFMLGLASAVTILAGFFSFEVLTYLASLIGVVEAATQSIILSYDQIVFSIPWSLGIAGSALVGYQVGENNKNQAVAYTKLIIMLVIFLELIIIALTNIFKYQIPYLYTSQPELVSMFIETIPIFTFCLLFDGMQAALMGILRGLGLQGFSSVVVIFSYYALSIPLAYTFSSHLGFGLRGLWLGQAIGIMMLLLISFAYLARLNWEKWIEKKYSILNKEKQEMLKQRSIFEKSVDEELELRIHDSLEARNEI